MVRMYQRRRVLVHCFVAFGVENARCSAKSLGAAVTRNCLGWALSKLRIGPCALAYGLVAECKLRIQAISATTG